VVNATGRPPRPGAARPAPPPGIRSGSAGRERRQRSLLHRTNGNPRRVWSHAQDVVYAIAFDAQGRVLLGAGNKGSVYRIESPTQYTALLTCR
jgi:hypothetical protein